MPLDHSWMTITYLYCTASAVEGENRDGGGGVGGGAVLSIFYVLIDDLALNGIICCCFASNSKRSKTMHHLNKVLCKVVDWKMFVL